MKNQNARMRAKSVQLYPPLCKPMGFSLPGSDSFILASAVFKRTGLCLKCLVHFLLEDLRREPNFIPGQLLAVSRIQMRRSIGSLSHHSTSIIWSLSLEQGLCREAGLQ